jgi:pimeloyl-ACP methyl ester carboxylesterase
VSDARELAVRSDGVTLSGESAGSGTSVVLLHGLTATRRYVVMGSKLLERSGMRVVSYDARGHGRSNPAPQRAYGYEHLAADLLAVMDAQGIERAVIAGASMGAGTAARFALEHPGRVAALGLITPAYEHDTPREQDQLARWDALAAGLREGGVQGFIDAYELSGVPESWRATIETVLRQRLEAHEHPEAVADALEVVPRSHPFGDISDLGGISAPTLIVASRDEADPGHPLRVGERWAHAIAGASLLVEDEGSPVAWQGGQLSQALLELAERAA